MKGVALVLVSCWLMLSAAQQYEYIYGTITWTSDGANVNFTVQTAWQYASAAPTVGTVLPSLGNFTFGDGNVQNELGGTVTEVNGVGKWVMTLTSVQHKYTQPTVNGLPYWAIFSGNARLSSLQNNANQSWQLMASVDCYVPASPSAQIGPIVDMFYVSDEFINLTIPATSNTIHQLHYLLGASIEICGEASGCTNPPQFALDLFYGIISWNTTSITPGLWNVVIMVGSGGLVIPVDFVINFQQVPGQCGKTCSSPGTNCIYDSDCGSCSPGCLKPQLPFFTSPLNNQSINVEAGQVLTFNITGVSPQSTYTVAIQEGILPEGAVVSAPSGNNPVEISFKWTPTVSQEGSSVVCFIATDNTQLSSPPYCVTIEVIVGCDSGCSYNQFCNSSNLCQCLPGYTGPACSLFGGPITDQETLYGEATSFYSQYFFTNTDPNMPIKVVLMGATYEYSFNLIVSTTPMGSFCIPQDEPCWTDTGADATVTVLPNDQYFIVGTYYIIISNYNPSPQEYNITLYL